MSENTVVAEWVVQMHRYDSWGWGDMQSFESKGEAIAAMEGMILRRKGPVTELYRVVRREQVERVTIIQSERRVSP